MELQWPLILFTTFMAWSAGLFGTQGVAALVGEGRRAQMPALVGSAVLLVVGGIAVFFHLEHWERIFNGFGNPTSGITQELVCVVVMAVLMVLVFVMLRKDVGGDGDAERSAFPAWLSVLAIVGAVLLVLVTGHSYMMAARPAWDSVLGPLSLLGAACALGSLTFAVIEVVRGEVVDKVVALAALVGTAANAALSAAYLVGMEMSTTSYTEVGGYFDPTHPTGGMVDMAVLSPFAGESVAMAVAAIVMAVVPVICALLGRKSDDWKLWGIVGVLSAVVGVVALRMVFYSVGASVYLFY